MRLENLRARLSWGSDRLQSLGAEMLHPGGTQLQEAILEEDTLATSPLLPKFSILPAQRT